MQCCICGKEFKNYNGLAHHIKQVHQCTSQEYYDNYIAPGVEHACKYCGKPVTKFLDLNRGYATTCGIACIRANAFKHVDQEARMQKIAETKLKRYGSASYNNSEKIAQTWADSTDEYKQKVKEKRMSTVKQKYGVEYPMQSPEVRETWAENYFEKTGYRHQCQNPEVQDKIKATTKAHFGVDNCWKSPEVKEKIKQAKLAKYGNQNNTEKTRETNLHKFGAPCCWSNPEVRSKCAQKYSYDGISFDSSWELAFYIYHKDHNLNIIYQPQIFFEFKAAGQTHRCFPDFQVGDCLYEVKGTQFVDSATGKWHDPYNTHNDEFYEQKHLALLDNGVIILYQQDIQKYLDYVKDVYGADYLSQFKNNKILDKEKPKNEC